jgi:hypothetical protein
MPKISPELADQYEIAPGVKLTSFVHPILGEVDLTKASKRLSAKLLKFGYIVEKKAKKPPPKGEE